MSFFVPAPSARALQPRSQLRIALPLTQASVVNPGASLELTVTRLIGLAVEQADRLASLTFPVSSPVRREQFRVSLVQKFAEVIGFAHERGEPVDPAELSRQARLVASAEAANYGVAGVSRRIQQTFDGIFWRLTKPKCVHQRYKPDKELDTFIDEMVAESLSVQRPSLTPGTVRLALAWVAVVPGAHPSPLFTDTVEHAYRWRLVVTDSAARFAESMMVASDITQQNIRDLLERVLVRVEQVAAGLERGTDEECRRLRGSLLYRFTVSYLRLIDHHIGPDRLTQPTLNIGALFNTIDAYHTTLGTALRVLTGRSDLGNEAPVKGSTFDGGREPGP